jgi:hypothetical protein
MSPLGPPGASPTDYQRRVVAYIYGNIPVSREELGEYLIARFGPERVEFLINRKIVEMACKAKGIEISDAQIEAQLKQDIASFGPTMTEKQFVDQVLKRFNKTLYEWKEDVIRPKLAMGALVRPTVEVTLEDIQKEFEARYGPKVQCRMIVLAKETPKQVQTQVREAAVKSEEGFLSEARKQFIPDLAARAGEIQPIFHHFPDPRIEKEAFSLKPGEVSSLMGMPDGTTILLRCEKHVPADDSKRLEAERLPLSKELFEGKVAAKIPLVFQEMRQQAQVRVMLENPNQLVPPALSGAPKQLLPPKAN